MKNSILAAMFFMMSATSAFAHSWYDPECCGENDCEPVRIRTDENGNFAILKNGQKWYVDKPKSIRPSKDDNYHVCIFMNQVWCFYVPSGT